MKKLETKDAEIYYWVRGEGEPIILPHQYPTTIKRAQSVMKQYRKLKKPAFNLSKRLHRKRFKRENAK